MQEINMSLQIRAWAGIMIATLSLGATSGEYDRASLDGHFLKQDRYFGFSSGYFGKWKNNTITFGHNPTSSPLSDQEALSIFQEAATSTIITASDLGRFTSVWVYSPQMRWQSKSEIISIKPGYGFWVK